LGNLNLGRVLDIGNVEEAGDCSIDEVNCYVCYVFGLNLNEDELDFDSS